MLRSGLVQFHDDLTDHLVDIDSVTPHPRNYNNGDVDAIAESIEVNGMYRPIFVQKATGHIVAGNHTWHACKMLDANQIPVVYLDIDDHTALRIMLTDNKTAALAVPDNALLLELLQDLQVNDSLTGTGYRDFDVDVLANLAKIPADLEEHATWPMIQVRVPPHLHRAYYVMTEAAVGDTERFELLMRLAGYDPSPERDGQ